MKTKRNRNIPISDRKELVRFITQFPAGTSYRAMAVKREASRYSVSPNVIYWHLRNS